MLCGGSWTSVEEGWQRGARGSGLLFKSQFADEYPCERRPQ